MAKVREKTEEKFQMERTQRGNFCIVLELLFVFLALFFFSVSIGFSIGMKSVAWYNFVMLFASFVLYEIFKFLQERRMKKQNYQVQAPIKKKRRRK